MAEPILLTRQLRKSYGTAVVTEVLHGIDLKLEVGSFTSLIGPSGSGKTTLLNLIGLLDQPTSGELLLSGIKTHELKSSQIAKIRSRSLGFIFQFHHLLPQFTAIENVLMPSWISDKKVGFDQVNRAKELLNRVGLDNILNQKAGALSGGQQQRVAIARALLNRPSLVLADEPTGNLDTENTEAVFELLRRINREDHTAILIVTHDRQIAAKSDRFIELVDGAIVRDENIEAGTAIVEDVTSAYCVHCHKEISQIRI
jgi:lipoprotein-releasing system ATP-binding protein